MSILRLTCVCICAMLSPVDSIDPAYAKNITVFHVNPQELGAKPVNMDTGDAAGDMFFDFHNVIILPLRCPHGAASGHGCSNPEAVAPNLVVNKVILEIDTRFSDYAKCNIGVNGTDAHGHSCKDGTYCCFCETASGQDQPCQDTLGREVVRDWFQHDSEKCTNHSEPWECFVANLPDKFTTQQPGNWYSSLQSGYCGSSMNSGKCTWRVVSVPKVVQKSCHNKVFFSAVEQEGTSCFQACGSDKANSSSPCWVNCFYSTVLGPDADKPGGKVAGMSLQSLVAAWLSPFESDDPTKGGCPPIADGHLHASARDQDAQQRMDISKPAWMPATTCLGVGYSCAKCMGRPCCCEGLVCDTSGPPKCEKDARQLIV